MQTMLRRAAAVIVGIAVAASTMVATETTATAAPSCRATFGTYSTIRSGSTGAKAEAMECLLSAAGFATTVNGRFSAADARALARFRDSVGLSPIRVGGKRAWSALLSRGSTPALRTGSKGEAVLRLQLSLRAAGISAPASGSFGSSTAKAVKAAQKAQHLRQTGVVNDALWSALQHGKISVKKASAASTTGRTKGQKALAYAKRQLGERYRYGAAGPNAWDCSGLTMKAWKSAGVKLPHSSRRQYKIGKKVSRSHLRAGDLVFFYSGISHVGIYAGKGRVIHASRPGKPVAYIKIKYMPYKGARRPG